MQPEPLIFAPSMEPFCGHLMLYRSDSSQAISRSLFTFAAQNLPLQDFLGCHSEHCHQVGHTVFLFCFPLEVISSYLQMWNPIIQWLAFVFPKKTSQFSCIHHFEAKPFGIMILNVQGDRHSCNFSCTEQIWE